MYKSNKQSLRERKAAEKQKRKEEKRAEKEAKKAGKSKKKAKYSIEEAAPTEHEGAPSSGPERVEQAYEDRRSDMPQQPAQREAQDEVPAAPMGTYTEAGAAGAAAAGPSLPTERETHAAVQASPAGIAEAEQMESEPLGAIPETKARSEPSGDGEWKRKGTPERRESRRRSWFGRSRSRNEPSGKASQEEPPRAPTTEEMAGTSSAIATAPAAAASETVGAETAAPTSQMAGHEGAETLTVPASATATQPTAPAALQEGSQPVSRWSPSEASMAQTPAPATTTATAPAPTAAATTAATGGNGAAVPVKTTTVKKQRRSWRSFFSRSPPARNTEGTQGSFDAQRMATGRTIGEQEGGGAGMGGSEAPHAGQGVEETGSTPTPSVGRFQEVL